MRALVAEVIGRAEPFQRLAVGALLRDDHAREGGGHLGPQRDLALAAVGELVELTEDLGAALVFLRVELHRLEHGAVHLDEAVAARDAAPAVEHVAAAGAVLGIEVTKSGQRAHGVEGEKNVCLQMKRHGNVKDVEAAMPVSAGPFEREMPRRRHDGFEIARDKNDFARTDIDLEVGDSHCRLAWRQNAPPLGMVQGVDQFKMDE